MIRKQDALDALQRLLSQVGAGDPDRGFAIEDCLDAIDELPEQDAAPVIHAKWLNVKRVDAHGHDVDKTLCTRCRQTNKVYSPPWCPHCGAKMDAV